MTWQAIGGLLGGIGLFLLGMHLMTEGMKVAAGPLLRDILGRWTQSNRRAFASGVLITALVQSSSAVTIATIGFVNAGLLTFGQSVWVIFGSNVGTTMTGWIVAAVGINLKIELLALPLIGLGMAIRLTGGVGTRRGAIGEALAGFGLFFLGIAFLKDSFGGLSQGLDLSAIAVGGVLGTLIFVGVGIVMTFLMQSSSAAIAIALTAASGGVIGPEAAAAVVIGTNVGTTTTALLAVIQATPAAKRVAAAHLVFNVLTGIVALALLPALIALIGAIGGGEGGRADDPAWMLAAFHTLFNLIGVGLMIPVTPRLLRFLSNRFVDVSEALGRPQHLDKTGLAVPAIALRGLHLELERLIDIAQEIAADAVSGSGADPWLRTQRRDGFRRLAAAIEDYSRKIATTALSPATAAALTHPYRVIHHLDELIGSAERAVTARVPDTAFDPTVADVLNAYRQVVGRRLTVLRSDDTAVGPPDGPDRDNAVEAPYRDLKAGFLNAVAMAEIDGPAGDGAIREANALREVVRRLIKARKRMIQFDVALADPDFAPAPEVVETAPRLTRDSD